VGPNLATQAGRARPAVLRAAALAALAGVSLAACSRAELYTGLNEKEANEMVAVVQNAGFTASKMSKDNGKTWTIVAPKEQFPQEVALLQARGYPRERYESLGDVFKKSGFVSSPTEERARLMYGLSQEISKTLTELDGVVDARVQIAVPESDPLSDTPKPSSASVLIKYDPAYDLSSQTGSIKALVVNSVEGLPYDKVTVLLSPVHAPPPKAQTSTAASIGAPALAAVAVLGGAAGFGLWRRQRRKKVGGRELTA
jgi:type III secretion protein J